MKKNKNVREKTHERIARLFKVKPYYVQYILKIGDVNDEYFERLRIGRIALYVAYNACVSEAKGVYPPVPTDSDPVLFTESEDDELVSNSKQVRTINYTCEVCGAKHKIEIDEEQDEEE